MSIPLRLVPLYFCNIERINEYEKDTVFIIRSNNDKHSRNYGTGKSYRKRRSERQGGFPAGNDFPHRRAEHRLRQVFHRQQLSGSDIQGGYLSAMSLSSRDAATTGTFTMPRKAVDRCWSA